MHREEFRELLLRCAAARTEAESALRTGRRRRHALHVLLTVLPELHVAIEAQERPLLRLREERSRA